MRADVIPYIGVRLEYGNEISAGRTSSVILAVSDGALDVNLSLCHVLRYFEMEQFYQSGYMVYIRSEMNEITHRKRRLRLVVDLADNCLIG